MKIDVADLNWRKMPYGGIRFISIYKDRGQGVMGERIAFIDLGEERNDNVSIEVDQDSGIILKLEQEWRKMKGKKIKKKKKFLFRIY